MATARGAGCRGPSQRTVASIDENPTSTCALIAVETGKAAHGAPSVAFDAPLNVQLAYVVVMAVLSASKADGALPPLPLGRISHEDFGPRAFTCSITAAP